MTKCTHHHWFWLVWKRQRNPETKAKKQIRRLRNQGVCPNYLTTYKGIKKAQNIISMKLTKGYLTWYYIEALKALSQSDNTTFLFAPYDQTLIPMLNINK